MHKLSHFLNDVPVQYTHSKEYARRRYKSGNAVLVTGLPAGDIDTFISLIDILRGPFYVLYVLHTQRGEGEPGRYQSRLLSHSKLSKFLDRFETYLISDSRFDIWVYSQPLQATVVWDRHDLVHAYGPIDEYEKILSNLGFVAGQPNINFPHIHHYRKENDELAKEILAAFDWIYSPLEAQDLQSSSGD